MGFLCGGFFYSAITDLLSVVAMVLPMIQFGVLQRTLWREGQVFSSTSVHCSQSCSVGSVVDV